MKALLAALVLGALAFAAAPSAQAAPFAPVPAPIAHHGVVGVGVGIGGGYVAPRPYLTVTGYRTEVRTVFLGYDRFGRPLYTTQQVRVPVYGWVYPAYRPYYAPYVSPYVSFGVGFRL